MPNFLSIINSHNKKILNKNIVKVNESCPLDGNRLQSSLVYVCKSATPKITNDYPYYICLKRTRLRTDCISIKLRSDIKARKNATELPNFV